MATSLLMMMALLSFAVLVEGGFGPLTDENRIIGGAEIVIYQVPWQVSLQSDGRHICGGAIISKQWVLTAAHCTVDEQPSHLKIRVGSSSTVEGGKLYQVEHFVNHGNYDQEDILNDISALRTTSAIGFGPSVGKVKLPKLFASRPPAGTKLRISGWGFTEGRHRTTLLRAVDIELLHFDECRQYFRATDESTQVCAGSKDKNICKGDSGGPLVDDILLVGIVSYSDHDCRSPGDGYTDVAVYRQWIKTQTGV